MAKSHWTKAEPRGCPLIDLVCFYLDDAAQKEDVTNFVSCLI